MFTRISVYRAHPNEVSSHDEALEHSHHVVAAQPGFLGRLVGRKLDDDGEYIEALQWESSAHAASAFTTVSSDPAVRKWLAYLDRPSVKMWGMTTVGVIGRAERPFADRSTGAWLLVKWSTLEHVDPTTHSHNELLMHHEVFAPARDYQGAIVLREAGGVERMELIAWSDLDAGRTRVPQILSSGSKLVQQHMADCGPGASLHYVTPVLRA